MLTFKPDRCFLSNGASITASTSGIGDAGKIKIATGTLQLTNGASIRAFAFGLGDAGDITIQASDAVSLDGANSGIATITAFFGKKGGDITLSAGSLALNNGAQLLAANHRSRKFGEYHNSNSKWSFVRRSKRYLQWCLEFRTISSLYSECCFPRLITPSSIP